MNTLLDTQTTQQKFLTLKNLGAGEFAHLNGTLETHLQGTWQLLSSWGAEPDVCDAGLFHAAYGTDGFEDNMLALNERQKVAEIIGKQAEEIVYLYCACDRQYVFDRITGNQPIAFKNRFTQIESCLSETQARHFCELTVANELEIASQSRSFLTQHGDALQALFSRMKPFLSHSAKTAINTILKPTQEHHV